MKTLILSCNTGEGHNYCAKALCEFYRERGEVCDIADALSFVSQKLSDLVSRWFVRLYRYAPKLFDKGYNFSEDHPGLFDSDSTVYHLIAAGAGRLAEHIAAGGYDAVICTHVFSASMLTEAIREHGIKPRATSFVATDYSVYPMVNENNVDIIFIPYISLTDDFAAHGIARERIVASGIPVRRMFYKCADRDETKRKLSIPAGAPHLLVMCGSMGCGPMRELVTMISESMGDGAFVTVVCGTNDKLRVELEHEFGADARIRVLGFTQNIGELMDSADLYLTKPGGISVTEAAVKCLPMAFVDAVAGCEEGNFNFFIDCGGAVAAEDNDIGRLAEICVSLLGDGDKRGEMSAALRGLDLADAASVIYDAMKRRYEGPHPEG